MIVSKPYSDAINRTASRSLQPSRTNNDAGMMNAREIRYRPSPWYDVSTGKPFATTSTRSAYVLSSGAKFEALFGNAKNATTLTTNEAKTIAYNLLFKVVSRRLKSFIVIFYKIFDL